jgi:hypothetical protein
MFGRSTGSSSTEKPGSKGRIIAVVRAGVAAGQVKMKASQLRHVSRVRSFDLVGKRVCMMEAKELDSKESVTFIKLLRLSLVKQSQCFMAQRS